MPAMTKPFTNPTNPMKPSTKPKAPLTPLFPPKQERPSLEGMETTKPPPTPICADINSQIRLNPAHAYPDFDFASYVRHRSYTLCMIDFGSTTSACFLDDGVHNIVADLIAQLPATPSPTTPSFEIRDAKEKGLGMFATASIPSRGTVLTEHPTIITPYLLGLSVPLAEMYTEIFESLPKPVFALATSLVTSYQDYPRTKPSQGHSLPLPSFYEDIMQTNSVAISLQVPCDVPHHEITTHRALFLLLSRCNHSCNPNAAWSWDTSTLTLTLTALRPIAPGEEITISYIPLSGDHSMRQQTLREVYGFDCCCEECTLPPYERSAGDVTNHSKFNDSTGGYNSNSGEDTAYCILPTFEEWCVDPTLPDNILINAHKSALYRIERQSLQNLQSDRLKAPHLPQVPLGQPEDDIKMQKHSQTNAMHAGLDSTSTTAAQAIDYHVETIAMCYGALGEVTNFRNWVAIAKEARVRSCAPPEQKIAFNRWLSNPSSFPMWGWRQRAKGKVMLN